jgi:DNA-binding MarR family transcriptional regulator
LSEALSTASPSCGVTAVAGDSRLLIRIRTIRMRTFFSRGAMSEPGSEHVGHLLRLAQQVHTRMWANEVSADVTSQQFRLLRVLEESPHVDQRTATQLARLDRSTGSELIDRLARHGYVERRRDGMDRRRYLLELTPSGQRLVDELGPSAVRLHETLLAFVSEDLRQPFLAALAQFVERGERGDVLLSGERSHGARR